MNLNTCPKIDLHLHLDGSLPPKLFFELAAERGVLPPGVESYEQFLPTTRVKEENSSLYDFLALFDRPLSVLQDSHGLEQAVAGLLDTLAAEGHSYVEIRFAPQLHTQKGLRQEDAVRAAIYGLKSALVWNFPLRAQLILCGMILGPDSNNDAANRETVELAAKYLGKGVCAFDLAGAEGTVPMERYRPLFERARALEVPYTIHAGESFGPENVATALSFGAKRIGHGRSTVEDPAVLRHVLEAGATLECCVTSNVQCKLTPSPAVHPIRRLFDAGVKVTANTDNRTISGVTLPSELELLQRELAFTDGELGILYQNAVEAAFLPRGEKDYLLFRWEEWAK